MASFLSPRTQKALDRLNGLASDSPALERLAALRSAVASLESDPSTLASVRDALSRGASWEMIAEAAGLKPAAAKWRWQGSDEEIASRHEAGRKRSVRPSSVPSDLPGYSVADAARRLGVTPQAIYLKISRGKLLSRTVELEDGRRYKRVFLDGDAASEGAETDPA